MKWNVTCLSLTHRVQTLSDVCRMTASKRTPRIRYTPQPYAAAAMMSAAHTLMGRSSRVPLSLQSKC